MEANYLKRTRLIFILLGLFVSVQVVTAETSRHKVFSECLNDMGDKGREPEVLIDACTKAMDVVSVLEIGGVMPYQEIQE